MKSSLKVLFVGIVVLQAFFTLNLKAEECEVINTNQILACKDCG